MISRDELHTLMYDGSMCIQHNNSEQWLEIHDYLVCELSVESSISRLVHDYMEFPYVYIRNRRRADALREPERRNVISYQEFKEVVSGSEEQIRCPSLDDVL